MTPAEHAKAIEDAAEQYAYAYSIDDFKDRSKAFDVLQDAIWAGVRVDHSVDANKMVMRFICAPHQALAGPFRDRCLSG